MAYTPFGDWNNDAPPGLTAERMNVIEQGIKEASDDAEEALDLIAQGAAGITSVDGDVKRIYNSGTTPPDGAKASDLIITLADEPGSPLDIPDVLFWTDASATGARDLSTMLPDVSGNQNHIISRYPEASPSVASVSTLNGLPAYRILNARYWLPGNRTGVRTLAGVFKFLTKPTSADILFMYTGGTVALELGARATTGDLYCVAEGGTVYESALAWAGDDSAIVNFVITLSATHATLWLSGVQVGSIPISTAGTRGSLALFGSLSSAFDGVVGELMEYEGHVATPEEAAMLSKYFRDKWRV